MNVYYNSFWYEILFVFAQKWLFSLFLLLTWLLLDFVFFRWQVYYCVVCLNYCCHVLLWRKSCVVDDETCILLLYYLRKLFSCYVYLLHFWQCCKSVLSFWHYLTAYSQRLNFFLFFFLLCFHEFILCTFLFDHRDNQLAFRKIKYSANRTTKQPTFHRHFRLSNRVSKTMYSAISNIVIQFLVFILHLFLHLCQFSL